MKSLTPAFLVLLLAMGCATEPDSPSSGDDGLGGAREMDEPDPYGTGGAESDEDPVTNETGGASTGGASTGGASTGGASTGGAATGGAGTGGAGTGGAATGGSSTGGTGGSVAEDPFLCDAGTWDHDANDTTECAVCAAGTYCAGGEAPSVPCDAGEWDDDSDASTVCQPKSACSAGTRVSEPGSDVSDRSCADCQEGTYTDEDNLPTCLPQADCVAGQYVSTPGSTSQLRECAACEEGAFSDSENATECTPHSTCELDEQVVLPGSMTQDLKCACVYYVSASSGNDEEDGTSWLNAKATVPAAIAASGSTACEIWVELGTYYPTDDGDQSVSITVAWGIDLYGGFTGTETYRDERDFELNETILSGDLDQDGVNDAANSTHVIYPGSNTIIDGFTIEQGRAYTSGNYSGAGIYVINASPTIQNCVIRNNRAAYYGAGLYSDGGAIVRNTVFEGNAANRGGGVYINGRAYEHTFDHVVFRQNSASLGGALASVAGWAQIVDSSFIDNTCSGGGCGLYGINTALQIVGTNFSGNSDGVSQKDGGAILLEQDSVLWPTEVYISESTFSQNDGFDGGAVAVTDDAFLQVSRCEFVDNEAQWS